MEEDEDFSFIRIPLELLYLGVRRFIMTKTELELLKIQWRVDILEKVSITTFAFLFSALGRVPVQEFARALLDGLDIASRAGEAALLSPATPEDQRVLLAEEFGQVAEKMKSSFALMLANLPS
jgi:hypothetical protein